MLGEKLVRHSVTPISSATETNRFSNTSKAMGSMRMRSSGDGRARGDDVGERVEPEPEPGRDHGRGFAAGDHRRPVADGAGHQIGPLEEPRGHERAAETRLPDAVRLGDRWRRLET